MLMAPTSSSSLSIGTKRSVRAPPASASATNDGLALDVGLLRPDVGDMNDFVCASETPERGLGARMNDGFATSLFDMRFRSVQRDRAEPATLAQPHDPKLGCAKAGRVRQHGVERQACSSPGEVRMTPSTSDVAVCCSSASLRSAVR